VAVAVGAEEREGADRGRLGSGVAAGVEDRERVGEASIRVRGHAGDRGVQGFEHRIGEREEPEEGVPDARDHDLRARRRRPSSARIARRLDASRAISFGARS
jgi:hypothetical protein